MAWTKQQLIVQAWEEIGFAPQVYDLTPTQLESALRRLDAMLATWNARGLRIGWPQNSGPSLGSLYADTAAPDYAIEAIYLNLALRLAPTVGKQVSPETRNAAREAYQALVLRASAYPQERQYPETLPRGEGTKYWRDYGDPFNPEPTDPLSVGGDGELTFE